jgi:deferrochelatase/peroxidase EfeB
MSPSENKPPAGIKWERRTAADLATEAGRRTTENVWRCVQRGLVYPSPYATFATFFRREHPTSAMTTKRLGEVLADVRQTIHEKFPDAHTTAILGVGFGLWQEISIADGMPLPAGMRLRFGTGADDGERAEREPVRSEVFHRPGTAFTDSGADLWFHIKSDDEAHCEGVLAWLRERLEDERGLGRRRENSLASGSDEVEPTR